MYIRIVYEYAASILAILLNYIQLTTSIIILFKMHYYNLTGFSLVQVVAKRTAIVEICMVWHPKLHHY